MKPYRVGIVGLQPGRGWGSSAHLPALRALPDDFEVVGVANSSLASGEAAAAAFDLPRAFDDVQALVASDDVDVVVVTVKVPHHHAIASAAIAAGKAVYCEWPLGNGLAEARDLAARAKAGGVVGVVGLQALFSPQMVHLRRLLAEGYVGDVMSTTLTGVGMAWGPSTQQVGVYTLDASNGATLLTIPLGHTLAAVQQALGPVSELSATLATRRPGVRNLDTGEILTMTAPDQVLANGLLASGAPIAVHYRGGMSRGPGLAWDIHGTEGSLRITGPTGHVQLAPLTVCGARGEDNDLSPIPLPQDLAADFADGPVAGNVRRVYAAMAAELRGGPRAAPSFDDAVRLHQVIAAIETAAVTGARARPGNM